MALARAAFGVFERPERAGEASGLACSPAAPPLLRRRWAERERDTIGFNTYLQGGKFYAQRFRSTLPVLDNGCKQGAFFHMQEWKKRWGDGAQHFDPAAAFGTFKLSQDGIQRCCDGL